MFADISNVIFFSTFARKSSAYKVSVLILFPFAIDKVVLDIG